MPRKALTVSSVPELMESWAEENEAEGLDPTAVRFNSSMKVRWKCPEGHEWRATVNNRTRSGQRKGSNCGQCSTRASQGENEVATFLEQHGCSLKRSDRRIIAPYELDMVCEAKGFAVEFNGVYWHSEELIVRTRGMSSREFHEHKQNLARAQGVALFYVWQDDWEKRKSTVMKALSTYVATGKVSDILLRTYPME